MDRLPLEMWTAIFRHACVDGGRTGCVLAITSHYFRDAVLPVQLQSVALNDAIHAARFLQEFRAKPLRYRRVLYLFLSNVGWTAERQPDTPGWNEFKDIVHELLTLVAPDLRVLTDTIVSRGHNPHLLPDVSFPVLEELTIHGSLLALEGTPSLHYDTLAFPSLKYLHYVSQWEGVEIYTSRAPVLTHLRLSGIAGVSNTLRDALYQRLRGENIDNGIAMDPEHSPSPILSTSLEQVIVEPDTRLLRFPVPTNKLEALFALKDADTRHRLVLLRSETALGYDKSRDAPGVRERSYWDERLAGKAGCWAFPPDLIMQRRTRGGAFLGL